MDTPLAVLIVEDSEDDTLLVGRQLRRAGYDLVVERVDNAAAMNAALDARDWQVIIADYSMPQFSGMAALQIVQERGLDIPFILVSGTIGEELAVEAMRAGAHDYVMKDNLARLGPAVQRELQEARERQARRCAEESLLESEARFRKMAHSIQDGITIIEHGRVAYANERACEIFGYPLDEYVQLDGLRLAIPEERGRLREVIGRAKQTGKMPRALEFWIERRDGTRRCVQNRYSVRREDGQIIGRYVVTTDITEHKLAEREVEARRTYLERVLAAAPDAIVTLDAEHHVVEWNAGAERLFGYPREEAIDRNLDDLINDKTTLEQALGFTRHVLGGQELPPVEVVRYDRQGLPLDVIVSGSPIIVDGHLLGAVSIYTDISERKRAERLLHALNEAALAVEQALTIQEIFDTLGKEFEKLGFYCAVFLIDPARRFLHVGYLSHQPRASRIVEKLTGIGVDELTFPIEEVDIFRQIVHHRQSVHARLDDILGQAILPDMPPNARIRRLLTTRQVIGAPLIVEDEVIGLLSVQAEDLGAGDVPAITAFAHQMAAAWRKAQLLQDLEESLEQLKRTQAQFLQAQKMEAIGRLAGGVAHDFNNALTIIRLSLQLMQRQLHHDDPLCEFVSQIDEASRRATHLTNQLLAFGRREVVEPQVIDLNEAVVNLSQMLGRVLGEDVELVTLLSGEVWPVCIDPTQLDQTIINLAVNARDAMPRGGALCIETSNAVIDRAYAARHIDLEPGDYALLSVTDTGMGMDEEVLAHLFEPFYTTKERGKGTGLGLATVYSIVKRYDGHIRVHSEVARGTAFRIYLPRVPGDAGLEGEQRPRVDGGHGSETVLLVEEDPAVRDMTSQILEEQGYTVLAAGGGPAALEVARAHDGPIHLLLADTVLPQMDGRELASRLNTHRPDLRVVYISGYGTSVVTKRGASRAPGSLLPKPFTVEKLTQVVRRALDAPR
ncbi:MAG: PAS domain S-box protein [Anaerolineae bacterium]|jgi:PAS domain S-box-containing protein